MITITFPRHAGVNFDKGSSDKALELEPVKFEEIDSTYLSEFPIYDDILLSAVTSTKTKLSKTMAAFMRSLNKALSGTGIKAGQKAEFYDDGGQSVEQVGVLLSKPRKAGMFAVMTAQIPCSDGQSVSIIFYAPDEDPLKITNDDTLIAFRFLLNKRDITHKVAPNQGRDISLAQTTQALSNLLEKNSAKFKANLVKAMAARKEFADKQEELERLQESLTNTLFSISEMESENAELASRKSQLEAEKLAAEKRFTGLKAKIDSFQPQEPIQESPSTEEPEHPEELKRHLKTLNALSAGGFIVEEAAEKISEISKYFEKGMWWHYHGKEFNKATDLIAEAIEARLEVSKDAN
ncbi:hypothetical protein [Vibrio sonorensis]|uniref:defense against restriction DarA-related protein n=1 Tax=Vibrio sonorensis TaxID=1004316 RepID=UPI0008D9B373|nr:hypothetical protein [Vibrio sonorensis]